jgi:phage shock protein PspC (stress-responsive transcriptional regulator)
MSSRHKNAFPQPWLAGVCAWIAWQLDWNVSGVRIGALLMLFIMPVATVVAYLLGALCLGLQCEGGRTPPVAFDAELERRRRR